MMRIYRLRNDVRNSNHVDGASSEPVNGVDGIAKGHQSVVPGPLRQAISK